MTKDVAFQLRMPGELHEALTRHAQIVGESMNAVIVAALRDHLVRIGSDEFERLMQLARSQYRLALDKLADL